MSLRFTHTILYIDINAGNYGKLRFHLGTQSREEICKCYIPFALYRNRILTHQHLLSTILYCIAVASISDYCFCDIPTKSINPQLLSH